MSGPTLQGYFEEQSLVLIKTAIVGKTIALRTRLSDTVGMVKTKLHGIIGILPKQQQLSYHNFILEDHRSLLQQGMVRKSTLKVSLRLPPAGFDSDQPKPNLSSSSLSLTLLLPNHRRETVQVNPASSLAELQDFAVWLHESQARTSRSPTEDQSLVAVSPRALHNVSGLQAEASMMETPEVTKESIERTNRTIQNALQSLFSLDRPQQEDEDTVEDKSKRRPIADFGEI